MKKPDEVKKVKDDPTCFECNHYEVCQKWSKAGYLHRDNPKKCFDFTGRSAERRRISALEIVVDEQDKAIQQLESQVPKWIPVEDTEHKPMHGKDYLCVCTLKDYPNERWLQVLRWFADENGNGYVQRPHFTDEGCCGMLVTHWSEKPELPPLPEPPKEETE